MYCITAQFVTEQILKKSQFIGIAIPCDNEKQILLAIKGLASQYADASHIAYAYRIKQDNGLTYRFHDAGEPTGTAGKPIFQHIEGKNLVNILVVVIRYYGGIKLGAGGLTRAYGNTARDVLEAAQIIPYIEMARVSLTLDYQQLQPLEYQLKKLDGLIISQDFAGQVKLLVQLPEANVKALLQTFVGSVL